MPVAAGLMLAGVSDEKAFRETREITLAMGEYFQIQDDVLDAYADPETLGEVWVVGIWGFGVMCSTLMPILRRLWVGVRGLGFRV
jgi:hypothetical protein